MTSLIDGELTIEFFRPNPELLRLEWSGRALGRAPEAALTPFLSNVLELARHEGASLELHFERLEHLSAATVPALLQFLRRARSARISVYVMYRPACRWQKPSFESLGVFEQVDAFIHLVPVEDASPMVGQRAAASA